MMHYACEMTVDDAAFQMLLNKAKANGGSALMLVAVNKDRNLLAKNDQG